MREHFKQAFQGHRHGHINGIELDSQEDHGGGRGTIFFGEESKPRIGKSSLRVSNAIVALLGNLVPPKSLI